MPACTLCLRAWRWAPHGAHRATGASWAGRLARFTAYHPPKLARLVAGWGVAESVSRILWLRGVSRMAPTSSFSNFFASSEPPRPTNALDSMRARVGSAITPAAQNAQAMQATVLPEKNSLCPNMSFKDRVRGCIACMCTGMVLSFLGFMSFWSE